MGSRPARRRPGGRVLTPAPAPAVGVDLGGTKVAAVTLAEGGVGPVRSCSTPSTLPALLAAVSGVVESCWRAAGQVGRPERVGVAVAGLVDVVRGVVARAPNLRALGPDTPLGPALCSALGADVVIENDATAATLAEAGLGAAPGARDLLGVFVGTGVGAGMILDGVVRRGPSGVAGELGHVPVGSDRRRCPCGGYGHVESYAGRAAIETELRRRVEAGVRTSLAADLTRDGRLRSSALAGAVAAGDVVACELAGDAALALGRGVAAAVRLVDVPTVVVGGGLAERLGPSFVEAVAAASADALAPLPATLDLRATALGGSAAACGAALAAARATTGPTARAAG